MTVKVKKPRKHPEQDLQRQLIRALGYMLPPNCFMTYFPLGGGGYMHGARMKQMGTRVGTPDILLIWKGSTYWLELKSPRGALSQQQVAVHSALRSAGCLVETVRSIEEALRCVRFFGIPLKESRWAA